MKTLLGILIIALLGQAAGAIDSSMREIRFTAAPSGDEPGTDASAVGYHLDVAQAKALYEAGDTVFADARPLEHYEEGHIAGAEHLDPDAFLEAEPPDFVFIYPPEQRIVIYCPGGECEASELVAVRLKGFGFTNLHILVPGYPGWVAAGLPTEEGAP
ncbi:MAG: rhodanese-like domain-containing protein [Phycisphaeraceae bacterium]|nr:rhodanese-like domain-containing protein [Phycisphaeraceae bacterium]